MPQNNLSMCFQNQRIISEYPKVSPSSFRLGVQGESHHFAATLLNTDKHHFITYSAAAYPLLALMKCGELPDSAAAK